MKVIQLNCVYPTGSTGQLVKALHQHLLFQGIDSLVIYGRGARCQEAGVRKLCPEWYAKCNHLYSCLRGILYGGCGFSTRRLIRILRRERPDVVHLHCINGYFVNIYRLVSWLNRHGIPTVLTLHAEFMYTANCGNALDCPNWRTGCGNCPRWKQETGSLFRDGTGESFRRMETAFQGFEERLSVVSVSPWLSGRARQSPILKGMRHITIPNGVDSRVFFRRPAENTWKIPTVFHATPLFSDDPAHLKGGRDVLELARRMPHVRFLVAGKNRLCAPVPENVVLLGEIRDREALALLYSSADLTLITSKSETFSMVCAESLCCGTPVVGFRCGGPESVHSPEFCSFVPQGDLDALEEAIRLGLYTPIDKERIARESACRYSLETMLDAYTRLYREVCL